jgi:ABC-type multidrug transport system fused ATPase/permease subunit
VKAFGRICETLAVFGNGPRAARWNIVEARWMRYFAQVLTSQRTAPEVPIFGLGEHFVQRFLDQFRTYIGRFGAIRRRLLRKGIELRDVTFVYPGTGRTVLDRLNLTIRPGECVALVGENGAGTSTLVKLLGRLHDPPRGKSWWTGSTGEWQKVAPSRAFIAPTPA